MFKKELNCHKVEALNLCHRFVNMCQHWRIALPCHWYPIISHAYYSFLLQIFLLIFEIDKMIKIFFVNAFDILHQLINFTPDILFNGDWQLKKFQTHYQKLYLL